jgi:hypothetical protein
MWLLASGFCLVTVMFSVGLCSFGGVMRGVMKVPLCRMGMMGCCFIASGFVVLCSFAMMAGCVVMVFGSFVVMFGSLLGHLSS